MSVDEPDLSITDFVKDSFNMHHFSPGMMNIEFVPLSASVAKHAMN